MRKETMGAFLLFGLTFAGLAGIALAGPAPKGVAVTPGALAKYDVFVSNLREVPAGQPLPGLHFDAKLNGRETDIYLCPTAFAVQYGLKVAKGDYLRIVGFAAPGKEDVFLVREVSTGLYEPAKNIFRPTLTIYLRNDDGPFWVDTSKPVD